MTRFARAHGSKASNERVPEEATSWKDIKRQLQELKEKQEIEATTSTKPIAAHLLQTEMKVKKKWATFQNEDQKSVKVKVPKKEKNSHMQPLCDNNDDNVSARKNMLKVKTGKVKKFKQSKLRKNDVVENKIQASRTDKIPSCFGVFKTSVLNVKERNNLKREKVLEKVEVMEDSNLSAPNKDRFYVKSNVHDGNYACSKLIKKIKPSKSQKIESGEPYKRRKPLQQDMVMTLNGREVSVAYFDGFLVKKEDAERLADLQEKLKAKKVPVAEIKEAIKLERRRAEKSLARERRMVCFHCRKSGHILSECPELVNEGETGICYKCGSTEHKVSKCRVGKVGQYRFAKCFVCSEQGHISAQCPNNSRGLYPKGGGCHVCGEVTHLKKDCPKFEEKQESPNLRIGTVSNGLLETLDDGPKSKAVSRPIKGKKAKHIHF